MFDELMHATMDDRESGMSLLLLAGLLRDRMPWLAEVLVESYRELKTAGPEEAREISRRLMRLVKHTVRGPFGERMLGRSKSGHFLLMELPHLIDRAVSSSLDTRLASEDQELVGPEEKV